MPPDGGARKAKRGPVVMAGKDRDGPPEQDGRKKDWIASQLRRVYDEALQEDIPAEMLALLGKLDEIPDEEDKS